MYTRVNIYVHGHVHTYTHVYTNVYTQYHSSLANVRFQGLLQMNTTRSIIALVGLLFLLQLCRFSATDFNQVHI